MKEEEKLACGLSIYSISADTKTQTHSHRRSRHICLNRALPLGFSRNRGIKRGGWAGLVSGKGPRPD